MNMKQINPVVVLTCPKLSILAEGYPAIWRSLLRFDGCNTKDRAFEMGLIKGYMAALVNAKQLQAEHADDAFNELWTLNEYADLVIAAQGDN